MTNQSPDDQRLLNALGGDEKLLRDFKRFQNKEQQRVVKRDLELKTQDILEGELQEENAVAIEDLNKVYRKAWTMACKELEQDEVEFPSRY